jgi:hypothetical protein
MALNKGGRLMTITERMIEVKNNLVEADRQAAIAALTDYIYHEIGSRVSDGASRYVLFNNDSYVESFRSGARIEQSALWWLLGRMKDEGLVEISDSIISLTALGINSLCKPESTRS